MWSREITTTCAVSADKIADGAVNFANVADGAVTSAKLASTLTSQ